ncbi:hypothetical protein ACROYT_G003541 [Oculina patagonica]
MLIKISQCPVPVMVDTWNNEATEAYGAFPERLFILQQGQIVYEGGTGPYNYVLPEELGPIQGRSTQSDSIRAKVFSKNNARN